MLKALTDFAELDQLPRDRQLAILADLDSASQTLRKKLRETLELSDLFDNFSILNRKDRFGRPRMEAAFARNGITTVAQLVEALHNDSLKDMPGLRFRGRQLWIERELERHHLLSPDKR